MVLTDFGLTPRDYAQLECASKDFWQPHGYGLSIPEHAARVRLSREGYSHHGDYIVGLKQQFPSFKQCLQVVLAVQDSYTPVAAAW